MKKFAMVLLVLLVAGSVFAGGGKDKKGGGSTGEIVAGTWTWIPKTPADKDDGDTSICTLVEADEEIDGETVHTYTLSGTVTSAIQYGLAECFIEPDEATLELLKTCKAVSFKVTGDGKRYMLEAPISTVKDWGYHVFNFDTGPDTTEYVVQMRMFMQPSWAQSVLFNQSRIVRFIFKTKNAAEGGVGDFSAKIWDLKLHM